MALSLEAKLEAIKMSNFKFTSFEKKVTTGDDGKRMAYLILELDSPIPKVTGTNGMWSNALQKRVPYTVTDVTKVRVKVEDIVKYQDEFTFVEDAKEVLTGEGSYSGDMFLDVSAGEHVWLKDTSFSNEAKDFKRSKAEEKIQVMINRSAGGEL